MSDRYRWVAPAYDLVSGEPIYRAGRRAALALLELPVGACVLDLGCGTGLNLPHLQAAIGPTGTVLGVDRSAAMLDRARRRAGRAGWGNVVLHRADATRVEAPELRRWAGRPIDAVISCYALSLMPQWRRAWATVTELDAAVAVVDLDHPVSGGTIADRLARLACWLGGSDIDAQPWRAVESDCAEVRSAAAAGGHIQVRVGRC